jgi:manganese transport protein
MSAQLDYRADMTPMLPGRSLEEVHRSVSIPKAHGWRRFFAYAGPAYMVAVGYMDPGNWATDLEGGARFGYRLIWVLLMSNIMAVLLQTLSARLGLVTGRDLAQACRDSYTPFVRWVLFILCEIAIAACDLAEVLGTAIGLQLLTSQIFGGGGIPLVWAVLITGLDVFLLLAIQRLGIRKMEAFILSLVTIVGVCFIVEIFLSKPSPAGIAGGFVPRPLAGHMLVVAVGILGATVMPHNLYLHSALVQTRRVDRTSAGIAEACKYNFWDSAIALNCAFFINAAILIVAAAAFASRGIVVSDIQEAHRLLEGVLGTKLAPTAFAIALIAAGQSSTLTGTLAGQITMEGFLQFRIRPWLRRLITRSLAIIPAIIVISLTGEGGTTNLLVLSQVILSLQLSFAVVPLVKFTSSKLRMGNFASPLWVTITAWVVAVIIMGLNGKLVAEKLMEWVSLAGPAKWEGHLGAWLSAASALQWIIAVVALATIGGLVVLLAWMTFRRERPVEVREAPVTADEVFDAAARVERPIRRVGVALEAIREDADMLAEAAAVAAANNAELVLMHVVEGAGGLYHGAVADDAEVRSDEKYLLQIAERLRAEAAAPRPGRPAVAAVRTVLGFGDVTRELIRLAQQEQLDFLVVGGHGHRGVMDLWRGETINGVRHRLSIPVLAVRGKSKPAAGKAQP